jgi:hypothetical protein
VPSARAPRTPPRGYALARVPAPRIPAEVPRQHLALAPKQRDVGAVPNPRRPKLVRDVHGGVLQDLFDFFPDLPRPRRPAVRRRRQR